MIHGSIGKRGSIKIGQKIPDQNGDEQGDNETCRHSPPGMRFPLERPSSPVHTVKESRPEPDHSKPEVERAYDPSGIDKFHEEKSHGREKGPEQGHSNSCNETRF